MPLVRVCRSDDEVCELLLTGNCACPHKIVTTFVYPPIPIRINDWSAHYEGEEDERMDMGWGATEQEAIDDLKTNFPRDE